MLWLGPVEQTGPKTVLVVDDEELFLRSVADGFATLAGRVRLLTAPNGRAALDVLREERVDLLVTDLHMPVMDGFELLAQLSQSGPSVPVIVMSAFGTSETEKLLDETGVSLFLDKPLDIQVLSERVLEALSASARGFLSGLSLPTFLQMIEADRKTCSVRVRSGDAWGELHFRKGELVDADLGDLHGDTAALQMACWSGPTLEVAAGGLARPKRIQGTLQGILLEAYRQMDEAARNRKQKAGAQGAPQAPGSSTAGASTKVEKATEENMGAMDKLKELQVVDGFAGAAVFTPTGEQLAMLQGDAAHLKEVGILANNVLLNAQKASLEMGAGRGQQVHIEGEKAHVLVRCLNEGTDPLKSQPGKAHIHVVLVLKNDASIGLAKMRINSVAERMGEDFRM